MPDLRDGERSESLGQYQMLWSCGFCGTDKLLGVTHRYCPECGAPQDPTRRYFPSDADKVSVENHVYVGADRTCPACSAPQSANARHCAHCGAPLDGAAEVKRVADAAAAPRPAKAAPRRRRRWLILVALAALLSTLYAVCVWKRTAEMTVVGRRWERAIAIEELRDVRREAWRDQVPLSARGVSCHREQRSSRQVPDGEVCRRERIDRGDGTFEEVNRCRTRYRSEPIYDDRCSYSVMEWTRVDEAVQRGVADVEPAWPALSLPARQQGPGARREGPRREVYTVELREGGKTHACPVSAARWKQLRDGQTIAVEVGGLTGRLSCDSLR